MSDMIFLCPECNHESQHVLNVLTKETTFLCSNCHVLFRIVPHRILDLGHRSETHGNCQMDETSVLPSPHATSAPAFNIVGKLMGELNEVEDMISHHAPKDQIEIKLSDCLTDIEGIRVSLG